MSLMRPSRCFPARVDLLQVRQERVLAQVLHLLLEHLGVADDGVQRRPQLVGHVGQELGLVPAGNFQLAALLLDLLEQPRVLNGERRLTGKGLEQLDGGRRELAGRLARDDQAAQDAALHQERDGQQCTLAGLREGIRGGGRGTRPRSSRSGTWTGTRVAAARPTAPSPSRGGSAWSAASSQRRTAGSRADGTRRSPRHTRRSRHHRSRPALGACDDRAQARAPGPGWS